MVFCIYQINSIINNYWLHLIDKFNVVHMFSKIFPWKRRPKLAFLPLCVCVCMCVHLCVLMHLCRIFEASCGALSLCRTKTIESRRLWHSKLIIGIVCVTSQRLSCFLSHLTFSWEKNGGRYLLKFSTQSKRMEIYWIWISFVSRHTPF